RRKRRGYNPATNLGRSSVGGAAVSKAVGRGFESLRPCRVVEPRAARLRGLRLLSAANAKPFDTAGKRSKRATTGAQLARTRWAITAECEARRSTPRADTSRLTCAD